MSEKFHQHIKKAGEGVSLSHEERERMHRTLHAYMEMKPIRTPSPFVSTTRFGWMFTIRPILASLVLIFLVSSAGISSSAENALPGDLLYPIKTQFNEPIQGTFAFSASEKTLWANNVAQERVKEAATLDAQGRLSSTTQEELQLNFQEHTQTADEDATPAAAPSLNSLNTHATTTVTAVASTVESAFQVRVKEYENILSRVAGRKGGAFASSTWDGDGGSRAYSTSTPEYDRIFPGESSSTPSFKKTPPSEKNHHHTDSTNAVSTEDINITMNTSIASTTTVTTQTNQGQNTQIPNAPVTIPTFPIHFPF